MLSRVSISGVDLSITRTCIVMVIQDLLQALGLNKDVYLYLDDNSLILKSKTENKILQSETDSLSEFVKVNSIEEDISEVDVPRSVLYSKNIPIFLDKELEVDIRPITYKKVITLQFTYGNKDINIIKMLENNLKLIDPSTSGIYYHNLEYSYLLPSFIQSLLEHIHYLKTTTLEKLNLPIQDLPTFIRARSDGRFSYNTTSSKDENKIELSIRERQAGVLGQFETQDFKNVKLEELDDLNAFGINFNYKFTMEFPFAMLVEYPILIHNQRLHKNFFKVIKIKDTPDHNRYSLDNTYFKMFGSKSTTQLQTFYSHLRLPKIDKELDLVLPPGYTKLFTCLLQVDEDNLKELCNINNIYKVTFTKPYLDYLNLNNELVGEKYKSIIYFCLSKGNFYDNNIKVLMDKEGNLTSNKDLDILETYRLHCYFLYDLNMLQNKLEHINFLKEEHLKNVDLINNELRDKGFDLTNYRRINTKQNKELIQEVLEVRTKYLSTLEELTYTFNLSKKEVEEIIQDNTNPSNRFFKIAYKDGDNNVTKNLKKGIISLNLFRILKQI